MSESEPEKTPRKVLHVLHYSDVIKNQGLITIITLGHVAHGKSTLVRSITGVKTQKHKAELERNITINLGYANAKIWRHCQTQELQATPSHGKCPGPDWRLVQHISFIDSPGHESLMSTMISGAHNFDVGFLLIAGNDRIVPQTQTYEHLLALAAVGKGIPQGLVLHNKLDLITHEESLANLTKVQEFLEGSPAQELDILPISAQSGENVDKVLEYLTSANPRRMENINEPAQLVVIRSFNVNKPNMKIEDIKGGVIGGSLKSGHLKVGDYLQVQPGVIEGTRESGWIVRPLLARITSLFSERHSLDIAIPGGLLGIGTSLDAGLTKHNKLVGQMATHIGHGLPIVKALRIKYKNMMRMDGKDSDGNPKMKKAEPIENAETVRVCVHATSVEGVIQFYEDGGEDQQEKRGKTKGGKSSKHKKREFQIQLQAPVCCSESDNVVIMRMSGGRWTLSGTGIILSVEPVNKIIYPDGYEALKEEFEARRLAEPIQIVDDLMKPTVGVPAPTDPAASATEGVSSDLDPNQNLDKQQRYELLLEKIHSRTNDKSQEKLEIIAPRLRPHNRVTIWENFMAVIESIKSGYPGPEESSIDPKDVINVQPHFLKFLSEELATSYSINGENQLIINGRFRDGHAEKVLRNYLKQFRTCVNCGKMDSFLYKSLNMTMSYCNHCNSEHSITK